MAAALYNMALRQASSIQSDLTRLESEHPTSSTSVALQGQIAASLSSFTRTVEDYESMSKREVNEVKREKALGRVKKFREDEKEVRANLKRIKERDPSTWTGGNASVNGGGASASSSSLQNGPYGAYGSSSARATSAAHLESPFSLHARNNTSAANAYGAPIQQQQNDPLAAYKMNASAQAMFGGGGGGDGYSAREGHALREHSFIQNTEQQLDAFIAQGREVWGNLTEQRDILKGTQRRLLDAANTMGLSRNVINAIERRSTQDNIIFAVGVVFTLVCFFYIYKWFG